ncbi:MAG: uracil-xanthine permease [Clostridia bacterium]|nr:uracil-xanthine permease [Clostridia bacterium]
MSKKKFELGDGIYDAKQLGYPQMGLLGFQHMFAMFGATVLVPALTGLSVSATLLFAGLGTLFFHLVTKGKVPAFLGSSFAFIGGYAAVTQIGADEAGNAVHDYSLLPYACFGVACAGLVYLALAGLIRIFGAKKVMRFFPPIVTGPIIIAIGLTLSSSAIGNCSSNWLVAVIAIAIIIICNIFGKGMIKIIPIMLGVLGSSAIAVILDLTTSMEIFDPAKLEDFKAAAWVGLPFQMKDTVFGLLSSDFDKNLLVSAVITIMPISLATMVEHIGDISAISSTCKRNYIADPGLHRTLLGDGIATTLASLFGAPANTTYGENTGVLSLSKVFDPKVVRIAAYLAVLFSFSPKFAALVSLMPTATIGGASLVLYGMISAVGVRNVVENKVNFENTRNVIIAALILVLSIGINYAGAIQIPVGSVTISLSGLAVGALVGIILNAILPGKDYEFGTDEKGDKSVNFKV